MPCARPRAAQKKHFLRSVLLRLIELEPSPSHQQQGNHITKAKAARFQLAFQALEGQLEPRRLRFRYVVALLLMRRRRLKFDQTQQDGAQEVLLLRCTRTGARHTVVNPSLTDEELATVQDDVFQALGWE